MSRRAGQLRGYAAFVLLVALVGVLSGILALCGWLLPEGTATVPIDAPAEEQPVPGEVRCPTDFTEPLEVSSSELFDCPRLYDGALVHYRGEVVAGVLERGQRAWVHLNDDVYALQAGPLADHRTALGGNAGIAVSIPIEVAEAITFTGGATARGDIIEVTGRFLRADPADGGGPTIQADGARVAEVGRPVRIAVPPRRVVTAGVLALVVLSLLTAVIRARRR